MKNVFILSLLFTFSQKITHAQFYKAMLPSPAFNDSLQKIVSSFSNNYYSIQGEQTSAQPDVDTYEAIAGVPGSLQNSLFRFHSVKDTTASWQALLYDGENFNEAAKIYKNTYRLLNKARLTVNNDLILFKGSMEEPGESLRFYSSLLHASSSNNNYLHYTAEIEMVNSMDGWQVHLNLQNKKDDKDKY